MKLRHESDCDYRAGGKCSCGIDGNGGYHEKELTI